MKLNIYFQQSYLQQDFFSFLKLLKIFLTKRKIFHKTYLILHLVNRDKFDPIVPVADPLVFVSPQKYAKKRITNSLVKFKDFQYKANFELDKQQDKGIFTETFKDDETKKVRQNVHSLFMPSQKYILSLAKNTGFILLGKIPSMLCLSIFFVTPLFIKLFNLLARVLSTNR